MAADPIRAQHPPPRVLDACVAAAFALFLGLPAFVQAWKGPRVEARELEARVPEPAPRAPRDLDGLRAFTRGFDAWFGDRFGLRGSLLRLGALARWSVGGSPSPLLARGRGEWVFWDGGGALDAWRGARPLPTDTVQAWRALLEDRQAFLAERGVPYLVVLVPSKPHLYPERLPRGVERCGQSRLEQVLAALEGSPVGVLDLRAALGAARAADEGPDTTYYRLGLHWTPRGAQAAAEAIVARLAPAVPGIEPLARAEFVSRELADQGDSWARRMGLERWIPQRRIDYEPEPGWTVQRERIGRLEETWSGGRGRARGLLLHDSFGVALQRPLAESLGELRCLESYDLDPSQLAGPAPDVVIQLLAEEALTRFSPFFTPFGPRPATSRAELERRFDASSDVLLRVVLRTNQPPVRPIGDVRIVAGRDWAGGGLRVVTEDEAGALLLPGHRQRDGAGILRLSYHAPHTSFLDLVSAPGGRLRYDPARARRVPVERGSNDLLIELEPELLAGRLVIRPGLHGRQFVFQHIELRGIDR